MVGPRVSGPSFSALVCPAGHPGHPGGGGEEGMKHPRGMGWGKKVLGISIADEGCVSSDF